MATEKSRIHAYIEGRVQGVFFRASTRDRAAELGLRGWVRNLPDGRVELIAEGMKESLQALVEWCGSGPSQARVDDVDVRWEESRDEFDSFEVRR